MRKFYTSLFWKISAIFLFILLVISAVYMYISVFTAEMYFQETRQKLDTDIASHIAADNDCFNGDTVNTKVLESVFHNVMVINPSIEVYLLDTKGTILTYYAPNKVIKLEQVPLDPITKFIENDDGDFLLGVDPKSPHKEKAFSAAKVVEDGVFRGYIYVILAGEEYENASQLVFGSYILRLGARSMVIALLTASVIGFISIGFITRNVRKIVTVIREFKDGNLNARIALKGSSELTEIADSFNNMADTIVNNIDEIKKIDKLRRELIANVSHDLRTPISIIRGYVETVLIKEDKLTPEERRKYLETILGSSERLLSLIEELFELSKLEAKDKSPQLEVFSIEELIQDIHQKNSIRAEEKNIKMELIRSDTLPMIKADIGMIEKVLQNLIDNALKFTPDNGLIKLVVIEHDDGTLCVMVEDSGPGIPKEDIPNIFDKYCQIKRVSGENYSGMGLGLAIVKKIVDLHNFNIRIESKENHGAAFIINMPISR